MPTDTLQCEIDYSRPGPLLDIRRHGLSQGGVDDQPFSPKVIQFVKDLQPGSIRFFVQEYFAMLPAPGQYHWDSIDRMLQSVVVTGALPIMALTMKPPCLFPRIDQNITRPSDWAAWEQFIQAMASHFATDLKLPGLWYEVGNEPDIGEMGGCPYLFTPEDYAQYYDRTVRAVLRGDPSAKVGGPALALFMGDKQLAAQFAQALQQHYHSPLDFFSYHTYCPQTDEVVRQNQGNKRFLVELGEPFASATTVLDEWNISWVCNNQFGEFLQAAFAVDMVAALIDSPVDLSHYYHVADWPLYLDKWRSWYSPEGLDRLEKHWCSDYRGLHMFSLSGEPAASYVAYKMLYAMEGHRLPAPRPAPNIGLLASAQQRSCKALLWNYNYDHVQTQRITLNMVNLPAGAGISPRPRAFRLGGSTLRDLESIIAIRRGQMHEVKLESPPGSPPGHWDLTLEPYSVYLLSLEW